MAYDAERRAVLRVHSHLQLDSHVFWEFMERTSFIPRGLQELL